MVLELRLCWLTICWKLLVRMSQLKFETFSRLMPSSRLATLVILENHGFESQPNTLLRFHFEIRSPLKRMDATASQKSWKKKFATLAVKSNYVFELKGRPRTATPSHESLKSKTSSFPSEQNIVFGFVVKDYNSVAVSYSTGS